MPDKKVKAAVRADSAGLADVANSARGAVLGTPFRWDGEFQSRNLNAPNIYSGTGAPAAGTVPGQARIGDIYFRVDGGGPGSTHIYFCTVAGAPGTWLGIC